MNRIKSFLFVLILSGVILCGPGPVQAGENEMMDALIHKLVEKGVLTREEAREIRQEVAEEAGKTARSRQADIKDLVKGALPSMIAKAIWSGDLRLRHETQRRQPATDRNRERFRLRFGFVTKPWEALEIGVRLATGASGDPTSTNQSFSATFDKKAIFVDQAYAKYTPWLDVGGVLSTLGLTGGKMENPFVTIPEGIVWDGDVTPEGAALQWKSPQPVPLLDKLLPVKPFLNIGGFVISELSQDHGDPAVFGYQGGADIELPWGLAFQPAVTYYNFTGIKGINVANVTNAPAGNSTVTQGTARKFASDYNLISLQGKLGIPSILVQPVALLADYTYNEDNRISVSDNDESNIDDDGGWVAGLEIGKVTEKFGSWKTYYFRKRLESDAAFGAIADSDFGGGGTNHKGHILGVQMGLNKWASIGIKYFRTDEIEGAQNRFDTFQADLQTKF